MKMESWTNDISFIVSLRRDVSFAHDVSETPIMHRKIFILIITRRDVIAKRVQILRAQ